jgi:hypothetical protein
MCLASMRASLSIFSACATKSACSSGGGGTVLVFGFATLFGAGSGSGFGSAFGSGLGSA